MLLKLKKKQNKIKLRSEYINKKKNKRRQRESKDVGGNERSLSSSMKPYVINTEDDDINTLIGFENVVKIICQRRSSCS